MFRLLFEESFKKVNLGCKITNVNLGSEDVWLLLAERKLAPLYVWQDWWLLFHSRFLRISLRTISFWSFIWLLMKRMLPCLLCLVLGRWLFLWSRWHNWYGFAHCDCFDCFFLVESGCCTNNITENVRHINIEADECFKMWFLRLVIAWKGGNTAAGCIAVFLLINSNAFKGTFKMIAKRSFASPAKGSWSGFT